MAVYPIVERTLRTTSRHQLSLFELDILNLGTWTDHVLIWKLMKYEIDLSKYTHIHFSFATITSDYKVDISPVAGQFAKFIALKGVKRILSFGV